MPSRASLAPRARPEVFAVLRAPRFPQDEIADAVLLVLIGIGAPVLGLAQFQFLPVQAGQAAVFWKRRDLEVDRTILRLVGVPLLDEGLDHGDLFRKVRHRARFHVGRKTVQLPAILVKALRPLRREITQRLPGRLGIADGLVVHVGDIADVPGPHSAHLEDPPQDVLQHETPEIPDMSRSVDRGTTAINPEGFPIHRLQLTRLASQGVEQTHGRALTAPPVLRKPRERPASPDPGLRSFPRPRARDRGGDCNSPRRSESGRDRSEPRSRESPG